MQVVGPLARQYCLVLGQFLGRWPQAIGVNGHFGPEDECKKFAAIVQNLGNRRSDDLLTRHRRIDVTDDGWLEKFRGFLFLLQIPFHSDT